MGHDHALIENSSKYKRIFSHETYNKIIVDKTNFILIVAKSTSYRLSLWLDKCEVFLMPRRKHNIRSGDGWNNVC